MGHTKRLRLLQPLCLFTFMTVVVAFGPTAISRAHETDQYSVPVGRQFADLRYWLSQYMYDKLARALDKTNDKINRTLRDGEPTAATAKAQSPEELAWTVLLEFPPVINYIEVLESQLRSRNVQSQFPGLVVAYQPTTWIYHHPMLLLDPTKLTRLKRTSTVMVSGTYFGTDKMAHFIHMGYLYFRAYRQSVAGGLSEEQAIDNAVNMGAGSNFLSEKNILGSLVTGVNSNADKVADYAGMKFYRNLTEPVMLKGKMHPPLWVRDGEFFKCNDQVRRDNDFFTVFISDHWNEALLPNTYNLGIARWIKDEVRKRCPDILAFYCDSSGNPYSQSDFRRITEELSTYYGEDYGFEGDLDEMVCLATTCFEDGTTRQTVKMVSSARDSLGRSPLWRAARAGQVSQVESLVHSGPLNVADIDGETALHAAVRSGNLLVVRAVLRGGADTSALNRSGVTPLHLAAQNNSVEIVEVLLAHGANVESRDSFGCTPLYDGARRGSPAIVSLLLRAGADVQAADKFGTTPLHRAARAGRAEIIELLLAAGASPKISNLAGKTPVDEAAASRNGEAIQLLNHAKEIGRPVRATSAGEGVPLVSSPGQR